MAKIRDMAVGKELVGTSFSTLVLANPSSMSPSPVSSGATTMSFLVTVCPDPMNVDLLLVRLTSLLMVVMMRMKMMNGETGRGRRDPFLTGTREVQMREEMLTTERLIMTLSPNKR